MSLGSIMRVRANSPRFGNPPPPSPPPTLKRSSSRGALNTLQQQLNSGHTTSGRKTEQFETYVSKYPQ